MFIIFISTRRGKKSINLQPIYKLVHEQVACGVLRQRAKSMCSVLVVVQFDFSTGLCPLLDNRKAWLTMHDRVIARASEKQRRRRCWNRRASAETAIDRRDEIGSGHRIIVGHDAPDISSPCGQAH